MEEWQPLSRAASLVKVSRHSVARWVEAGMLKSKKGRVRNLEATLVEVSKVRELAKERKPGRPRKTDGGPGPRS